MKITFFIYLTTIIFSKEILVLNAELLIVLAFILFIYFTYNFSGNLIFSTLNEKSLHIQDQFNTLKMIKKDIFRTILLFFNNKLIFTSLLKNLFLNIKKNLTQYLKMCLKSLFHYEYKIYEFIFNFKFVYKIKIIDFLHFQFKYEINL